MPRRKQETQSWPPWVSDLVGAGPDRALMYKAAVASKRPLPTSARSPSQPGPAPPPVPRGGKSGEAEELFVISVFLKAFP